MKLIICFQLCCMMISAALFAQDKPMVEKTYVDVINDGISTAPDLIVINAINQNTNQTKEICLDVSTLFWCLQQEDIEEFNKNYKKYFLSKKENRTFTFKNSKSLERMHFDSYDLKNQDEIEFIIIKNHLRDSLKKINKMQESLLKSFYKYSDKRDNILKIITDSISKIRLLSDEEKKMINDLDDQYYDDYYAALIDKSDPKVSQQGRNLMTIWNSKINNYRNSYKAIEKGVSDMYFKFFQIYYEKYRLNFCHVAFKHGIVTQIGDEAAVVGFEKVVD
jgi:hypothetical protein